MNLKDLGRVYDRKLRDSGTFCSQSLECPEVIQTEVGPPPKFEGVGQPSRKEFHKDEVMQIENNEKVHTLCGEDSTEPEEEDKWNEDVSFNGKLYDSPNRHRHFGILLCHQVIT